MKNFSLEKIITKGKTRWIVLMVVLILAIVSTLYIGFRHQPQTPQTVTDGTISFQLRLNQYKVRTGSTITGEVNIINRTRKPLNSGCSNGILVGLENSSIGFNPVTLTQVCEPGNVLHPGNNWSAIQIDTVACDYFAKQPGHTLPICTPTSTPNLPVNEYQAAIYIVGIQGSYGNKPVIMPGNVVLVSN